MIRAAPRPKSPTKMPDVTGFQFVQGETKARWRLALKGGTIAAIRRLVAGETKRRKPRLGAPFSGWSGVVRAVPRSEIFRDYNRRTSPYGCFRFTRLAFILVPMGFVRRRQAGSPVAVAQFQRGGRIMASSVQGSAWPAVANAGVEASLDRASRAPIAALGYSCRRSSPAAGACDTVAARGNASTILRSAPAKLQGSGC